jgi:sugar phosphate isomerase/epimerase
MYTRREFTRVALAAAALPRALAWAASESTVAGIKFGVQTYSFRSFPRPDGSDLIQPILDALKACELTDCELWAPHLEPKGLSREKLRDWRLQTPDDHFVSVRKRFDAAGRTVSAFNYSFRNDFTDAEIDRGFDIARMLGASILTASTTLEVARRVVPFAEKHRMVVAMHNHSNVQDPNEFATPQSFATALAMSKYYRINLDIGHFTAANFDPVAYLQENHAHVTNLHVKDMKKGQAEGYTPWGEGDTPIPAVLQLLKKNKWPIRAHLEYEHEGTGTPVEEVRKCYEYAKKALG